MRAAPTRSPIAAEANDRSPLTPRPAKKGTHIDDGTDDMYDAMMSSAPILSNTAASEATTTGAAQAGG